MTNLGPTIGPKLGPIVRFHFQLAPVKLKVKTKQVGASVSFPQNLQYQTEFISDNFPEDNYCYDTFFKTKRSGLQSKNLKYCFHNYIIIRIIFICT